MKPSLPGSIKSVVTIIVALALMPSLALMIYSGYSGARADVEDVNRATLRSARNIARQQVTLVESTRILLLTLSHLADVRELNARDSSILFQNIVLQTPIYADIRLCDTDGNTLAASAAAGDLPEIVRGQIRAAAASEEAFAVRELAGHNNNAAPLINCLFPVRRDGQTLGVLLASIIVHVPAAELAKLEADSVEFLHIVDKQGHAIFVYPHVDGPRQEEDCVISCLWKEVGASSLHYGLVQRSEHRHIAFEKLFLEGGKETDLTIFLSISTSAIFERMRTRIIKDVLLLLGVAGFAVAVTGKLCNASLRIPVRKLLDAANRIKKGDLSTRIPENFVATELNILAKSLNSMTQSLETRDQELIAARDAASDASTAKSEFLANMSHEIRTPMNAILGMAYLAKNSELTQRQSGYLDNIQEEAGKLLATINDILDFSKIEAGKVQIETVSFALPGVLEKVLRAAEDEARRKALGFSSSLSPELPEYLEGDPLHLSQVLSSFLSHAVKWTEQGEVSFHCAPTVGAATEETLVFAISCTGGGAGSEELALLALEDARAEDTAGFENGQSLGLTIARRLVRLMHGTVEVQAGPETGIAVRILLPFSRTAAPETAAERNAAPPEAPLPGGEGGDAEAAPQKRESGDAHPADLTRLKNARILLVEDNLINQQIAEEILTSAGVSVRIASNGLEALALLNEMPRGDPYHMALMDLQMPELDGFAATRRIRLDERFKNLPIIAMTAHSMTTEWQQCRDVGMNDYITKPIDVPVLLGVISKWMRPPADTGLIHK